MVSPELPFYLLFAHDTFAHCAIYISLFFLSEVKAGSLPVEVFTVDTTRVFAFTLPNQVKAFFPGRFKYSISFYDAERRVSHNDSAVLYTTIATAETNHFN
jgi:hypothetical protein